MCLRRNTGKNIVALDWCYIYDDPYLRSSACRGFVVYIMDKKKESDKIKKELADLYGSKFFELYGRKVYEGMDIETAIWYCYNKFNGGKNG